MIGDEEYIKNNPSPYMNIMRMLKIQMETGYELSDRSCRYIQHYYDICNTNIVEVLKKEYEKHYKSLDENFVNYISAIFYNQYERYAY